MFTTPQAVVRKEMALSELLEVAAQVSINAVDISDSNQKFLLHLLETYADEVLEPGQVLTAQGVYMQKTHSQAILVCLDFAA
ncbi:MAG TPA: hypothetical protein V6C89_21545 [Drouetiella sp.]|jgi:hypothetical protein